MSIYDFSFVLDSFDYFRSIIYLILLYINKLSIKEEIEV